MTSTDPPGGQEAVRALTGHAAQHVASVLRELAGTFDETARLAADEAARREQAGRLDIAAKEREAARRAREGAQHARSYAEELLHTAVACDRREQPTGEQPGDVASGTIIERERVVRERERINEEREQIADERERVARERESVAHDRETVADRRELTSGEFVRRLETRQLAADRRERLADEREKIADERERLADERERAADERERLATLAAGDGNDVGRRERAEEQNARQVAASERQQAAIGREIAATEREVAGKEPAG